MINFKQNFVNPTIDIFDKAALICLIYDLDCYCESKIRGRFIHRHKYYTICKKGDFKLRNEKVLISHRFLWGKNVISTPRERGSSCLKVDVKSVESLQVKQISNDTSLRLMQ